MVSLMSVYYTLIQQRELSLLTTADKLREWLWNGREVDERVGSEVLKQASRTVKPKQIRESSLTSNIILQAPFELLGIAISLFLGGLAAYLGLAWKEHVNLGTGDRPNNQAVFIAFLVCTTFVLATFGQALGQKAREKHICQRAMKKTSSSVPQAQVPPTTV